MGKSVNDRLQKLPLDPESASARAEEIGRALLAESRHIRGPNFTTIGRDDLEWLFRRYDRDFFSGILDELLREGSRGGPLSFRLSERMTRAAGKTYALSRRQRTAAGAVMAYEYQIAISSILLFQTFREDDGPVTVCGAPCHNRLQALQRVFEHELIHLLEFLKSGKSSCSAQPFKGLALRIFGHAGVHHELLTPTERAETNHQVRVGDRVAFEHDGQLRLGVVNRITRRATVLVEHPQGRPYNDGKRYVTYYVPLAALRPVGWSGLDADGPAAG